MVYFRSKEFNKKGERKDNWRNLTEELRSTQIEYHNKSTYVVFEFYTKTILTILGGVAFITISKIENPKYAKILIQSAIYLLYFVTFLYSSLIINHQKAKIERWKRTFGISDILFWNEFYFITIAWVIVVFITNEISKLFV